ncbi:Eco57I restriction-modification methylase domain-containing protein [bacterium]|nr:Eco57I restriction-modification methylase domain-containing protein [bacterium]
MKPQFFEKTEINTISERLEEERIAHAVQTSDNHKEAYGQYFTPYSIADFMSSLFPATDKPIRLLDPGAGIGILACSFMCRILKENWQTSSIHVSAYDIDNNVYTALNENLAASTSAFKDSDYEIQTDDFLEKAAIEYTWHKDKTYTHVIMNPPYKKILTNSKERYYARILGLETVNLYSAFMGAAISLTEDNGYIVAIVPRSFCNGVYYKPFREFILKNCAINRIHLFESRDKAFKDESVLQENIIIMLQKNAVQQNIKISYCNDDSFTDLSEFEVPFSQILHENDKEKFFNIPTKQQVESKISEKYSNLKDLNIKVSTGPIVDFRIKDLLLKDYAENSYPLVYSVHFKNHRFSWPQKSKKPNAVLINEEVKKQLFPKGFYVVVKRFSTKEERKRIVASIVTPEDFIKNGMTFENHLNVFHANKNSLSENIAYGLVCWLNSTYIDEKFRLFSGHTQVNATDLRNLPYPDFKNLSKIGERLKSEKEWNQTVFDNLAGEFEK